MLRTSSSSLRRVGRLLGTVGLASVAAWAAHRAWQDTRGRLRTGTARVIHPLAFRPHSPFRDGHLGAREKDFDWARTGRA